jgi:hypothetical protein
MGREDEALREARPREQTGKLGLLRNLIGSLRAYLEGNVEECRTFIDAVATPALRDPESLYYMARQAARIGDISVALRTLDTALTHGLVCPGAFRADPWLASVRETPEFAEILSRADQLQKIAHAIFIESRGDRILRR